MCERNRVVTYYERGDEIQRLSSSRGQLEETRIRELITRHLPAVPAVVYDVGGGPGVMLVGLRGKDMRSILWIPFHFMWNKPPQHPKLNLTIQLQNSALEMPVI